ncbi:hypothetical protein ElyMa_004372100, partial [Elysia marginata]
MDQKNNRLAVKKRDKITRKTSERVTRRHRPDERHHMENSRQTARRRATSCS